MALTLSEREARLSESLAAFEHAPLFAREEKRKRLLSQADLLAQDAAGMAHLYENIAAIHRSGLFAGTPWEDPSRLVPGLVAGTLLSGPAGSTLEMLSELRMLAVAEGRLALPGCPPEAARHFLRQVLVYGFEYAFSTEELSENERYTRTEIRKVSLLFDLLKQHLPLPSLLPYLKEEIETIIAHRPVVVTRIKRILEQLQHLPPDLLDGPLRAYVEVLFAPTPLAQKAGTAHYYAEQLPHLPDAALEQEAQALSQQMLDTGLVSTFQLAFLQYAARERTALVPIALALNAHGRADYERHQAFVHQLILSFLVPGNKQGVYGLARTLQRNLFSQKTVWHAFSRLVKARLHPVIRERLEEGNLSPFALTAEQALIGGTLCVLGQPLGVRQGNNPTCQSARGISMWSRHAPGKLINLLIDTATTNNAVFRYEGELIESAGVQEGLTTAFDFKLDPVSIVLVPHLDKVYNEMMKRASLKHPGKDPHASVNPAFYGHWIQTGFKSVYNPLLYGIENYEEFIRIFYAAFHPEYNGGHHLIYPVPAGIFITDSGANMLGFHAISLLRIEQAPDGEWRAYFFNPNSQGKQDWGQRITPTVSGHGERHGESSLPAAQFAARVYAYHFNQLRLGDKPGKVPTATVAHITQLAKESWGRKYQWL